MVRRIAFASCVLAGAGCLFAGGPSQQGASPDYDSWASSAPSNGLLPGLDSSNLLFDNGDVSYLGVEVPDLITPSVLIYDNGGPNYLSGNEMTNWLQANDFTLASQSNVEHVNFSVLDTIVGSNLANWDGTANWFIYDNAGGAPGSLIASGAGTNITATFDQNLVFDFYDFSMDLDASECLDAGTYWLGLHLNKVCDVRADLYWSTTDPNGTFGHHEDTNCAGAFNGPGNEHSFSLTGTVGCGGGGLYANGAPDYANGNEMTNWLQANDFTLRAESTVAHVDFSVLDTNVGSNLANWDGTATWYIYDNASGAPGNLIASGAGTNVTATFDQTVGWDFYDFSMDLDAPKCLDAGTYWLGLHLNRACDVRADLYWSTTAPNGTFGHHEDTNCVGTFNASSNEHSFTLTGFDGCGGDVEMYLDGSRISNPEGCAEFCCLFNGDPLQNYQEDGLTIDVDDIHFRFTPCNFTDEHYYPNGGINERISITRTDGNDFGHVEFEVSHGFAGCDVSLWMTPYLNGVPQGQFTADVTAGALIGFEGIFDEVLVGSYADPATRDQMNEANLNAVVLDNVCFDSGAGDDCLTMVVSTLIANAPADWVVCGATPDVEVAIVYGFNPGNTSINGFAGYCADFGIDGVNQNKVVCRKKADGSGCITCRVGSLPARPGTRILTQAAMKGTCPDPCMSNLDDQIVQ